MAFGQALREARLKRGVTQQALGSEAYVSDSLISDIEHGRRKGSKEIRATLARALDYAKLYMEAAEEVTGGVYCTPWLDGDGVDLHRTSVWAKTCEELNEAIKAVSSADVINAPSKADEAHRQLVWDSLMQVLDARVAIDHYVAVICEEYGYSILDVYQEHRRKLESRGYVKPRQKRKGSF